jgi:RNase P/RNase MRP subunit p29
MTKSKNPIPSVTAIPLLSLSLLSLNFSPVVAAKVAAENETRSQPLLMAQQTTCTVTNIQTGQLALRQTPNGNSRAGLDNGNTVALLRQGSAPWVYVRVLQGPNRAVNGVEGWVNSNYLECGQASANSPVTCNVTNIQTGQLALRFTPNGRSRAGLDNGNTVTLLKEGSSPWVYVRVLQGPNRAINGVEGWVNSDYLDCAR